MSGLLVSGINIFWVNFAKICHRRHPYFSKSDFTNRRFAYKVSIESWLISFTSFPFANILPWSISEKNILYVSGNWGCLLLRMIRIVTKFCSLRYAERYLRVLHYIFVADNSGIYSCFLPVAAYINYEIWCDKNMVFHAICNCIKF